MDKPQLSTLDKKAVPTILAYPDVFHFSEVPEIIGTFSYVIEAYELSGIAVVVNVTNGIMIRVGDWNGKMLTPKNKLWSHQQKFIKDFAPGFIHLMVAAKIPQLEFYVSCNGDSQILVDVRISLNNMAGPGYIKDVFGKIMPSQKISAPPASITKEMLSNPRKMIFKPSLFKTIQRDTKLHALYARNWK